MCKAKGPECGVCIVSEDFMEYLFDFIGPCWVVIPGRVASTECREGVFHGKLHKVIDGLMAVPGWHGYMWLL